MGCNGAVGDVGRKKGVRNRLPRGYRWGVQWASRKGKRGRAKGGMIMGVKKDLMEEGKGIHVETENIILGDIKQGKERWRIIGVYVDEGIKVMVKKVENWMGRAGESHKTLLGGDFNARIGRVGGGYEGESGERKAKDERINGEGRKLIEWVEGNGWGIFNGCMKGDEEGEFTFTGGGEGTR